MQLRHLGVTPRKRPVPTPRRSHPVRRCIDAAVVGHDPTRRRRRTCAVGARHFRRCADRAAADRRHRRPRHRPAIAAGPRILADETARRRPGDPERARPSYVQDLQNALWTRPCERASRGRTRKRIAGRLRQGFRLRAAHRSESAETRSVLSSAARVVFVGRAALSSISSIAARKLPNVPARASRTSRRRSNRTTRSAAARARVLQRHGRLRQRRTRIRHTLDPDQTTPAPWINVIANPQFGFQIAADGGGYTWSLNSRENQLTPWSNDPVTDRPGEVLYVRDEDSGDLWGPTLAPVRDGDRAISAFATVKATAASSTSRMRSRSSCCVRAARGSHQDLAPDDPQTSQRLRKLSVTGVRRMGARHVHARIARHSS